MPLLGRIAAGRGLEAVALDDESFYLPPKLRFSRSGKRRYALRTVGQSMTGAGIEDGDVLVVEEDEDPADGEVVVALLRGGEEVTVKRIFRERGEAGEEVVRPRAENGDEEGVGGGGGGRGGAPRQRGRPREGRGRGGVRAPAARERGPRGPRRAGRGGGGAGKGRLRRAPAAGEAALGLRLQVFGPVDPARGRRGRRGWPRPGFQCVDPCGGSEHVGLQQFDLLAVRPLAERVAHGAGGVALAHRAGGPPGG